MNIQATSKSTYLATVLGGLMVMSSTTSHAQTGDETEFEIRAGYGHSDNVLRQDSNELSSGFGMVGLTVDVDIERPRFQFQALGDIDYLFYEESGVRDRPDGDLDAAFTIGIVPDRFEWYVDGTYSQIRQFPALGDTPDNLREFFVLRTGLTGRVPMGARSALVLDGAIGERDFRDQGDLDSQETTAGIGFFRQLRPRSSLSLFANISNIEYDDSSNTEYDIQRAFLRYESVLGSGDVTIDLGANRLDDDRPESDNSAQPLFGLTWSRDVGARSRLNIGASHRIADLGSSASVGDVSGIGATRPGRLTATQSPFNETTAVAGLTTTMERTRIGFGFSFAQQMYEDPADEDVDVVGLYFNLGRDLSETLELDFGVSLNNRSGVRTATESDDIILIAGLSKRFSPRFSARFEARFGDRDSNNASDFKESTFLLSFAYSPSGR